MRTLIQHSKGRTSPQAHRDIGDLKDDELTRGGFDGREAVLYRREDPTVFKATGRFRSTAADLHDIVPSDMTDADGGPQRLYYNAHATIWLSRRSKTMPFVQRNVDGDECWFVHEGRGIVETEFGPLSFEPGDYVVIPKAITHRWVIESESTLLFGIETVGEQRAPTYVGLGRHAPFDPDTIRVPDPSTVAPSTGGVEMRVKYDSEYSTLKLENHPFDVEGWKGDYFPFTFNVRDWNVIMSDSLHLPPSMHVFLVAEGVNIINLLPRPFESIEGTERIPWYHRNADYDEIAFIHGGESLGRPLHKGLVSHDPQGINHGFPERARDKSRREWDDHSRITWQIIMIETILPLKLDEVLQAAVMDD
ncbi:homogentisate 1,2-dioxygenase [Pseudarthrobacter sp. B4EP4b]|uniref:homogentisate 1,2-dioxygenase n=1 Tax=Pseudarthrobacter sp. B4EP4b TaxID=2590664 RepID=UPI00115178DF|nr:homogentisate 1,2-dioxygenase [Pseudarthrobacter sp. B4EP4b]